MSTADTASTTHFDHIPAGVLEDAIGSAVVPPRPGPFAASAAFGWRAMLKIKHVPEQLFDVTVFPVMMTLMFTYLFGGAIAGSTEAYLPFLLPGILVMSVVMTTMYTGTAINVDREKGVFDRFRTLPIWRLAPMVGYLLGDAFRYTMASIVIVLLGLGLGWRPAGGFLGVAAGIGVVVAFSFAVSWAWALVGLVARSERSVMGISMGVLFPMLFLSNIFVDPATMPSGLEAFVNVSPITYLVASVRSLMDGAPDGNALLWTFVSGAVLMVVFGALTLRAYNRR